MKTAKLDFFTQGLTMLKGMVTDPVFLLASTSTVGFIQMFTYRSDLTIDLFAITIMSFCIMTGLGVVKHWKEGMPNGKLFLSKTTVQLVVMASVILMGYIIAILLSVVFKIATEVVEGARVVPGFSLYFIFAGYAVMITYYIIKSADLIDFIFPKLLPKWFTAGLRMFRETGKYKDLLNFSEQQAGKGGEDGDPS
jgi:hypothetical protein